MRHVSERDEKEAVVRVLVLVHEGAARVDGAGENRRLKFYGLRDNLRRILIVGYNSHFDPDRAVTVPYRPDFSRREVQPIEEVKHRYYGASLAALVTVGMRKRYRLVVVEPRGTNAFFLRNDLAPLIPALDPREAFRMLNKIQRQQDQGFDIFALCDRHRLDLV